jgi:hypothetical protein
MEGTMFRTGRTRMLVAALALAALPGVAAAKSQYSKECKPSAHTGAATPVMHKTVAKQIAVKIWSGEVAGLYGQPWALWSIAAGKSVQCSEAGYGPVKVSCTATARPCRYRIDATETHPPYPNIDIGIGIGIGIGGFGLGRPGGIHRPPRGFGRPAFGPSIGRRRR